MTLSTVHRLSVHGDPCAVNTISTFPQLRLYPTEAFKLEMADHGMTYCEEEGKRRVVTYIRILEMVDHGMTYCEEEGGKKEV